METTRSKVIERSVVIEDVISQLLCFLLDIDKQNSNFFGTKSHSLSFNSKIALLTELNFISKEEKKDFELFQQIRNKFAHVLYEDSFEKCFEVLDSNSSRNRLLSKFQANNYDIKNEGLLNICFDSLCLELQILLQINSKLIHEKKTQELNRTKALIEIIQKFLVNQKKGEYDELIKIIENQINELFPNEAFNELLNETK